MSPESGVSGLMMPATEGGGKRKVLTMSVETPTANGIEVENKQSMTYTFKTTEENRSESVNAHMSESAKEHIKNTVIQSPKWRSYSQYVNDALIYYLNGGDEIPSVDHIRTVASRDHRHHISAAVTPTLHDEIKMLVQHSHTPWESKQEFYTCALYTYLNAGEPMMERR